MPLGENLVKGRVMWFSRGKGYGFIRPFLPDDSDIFVHFSEIENQLVNGRKSLLDDQIVTFEIQTDEKGRRKAVRVRATQPRVEVQS